MYIDELSNYKILNSIFKWWCEKFVVLMISCVFMNAILILVIAVWMNKLAGRRVAKSSTLQVCTPNLSNSQHALRFRSMLVSHKRKKGKDLNVGNLISPNFYISLVKEIDRIQRWTHDPSPAINILSCEIINSPNKEVYLYCSNHPNTGTIKQFNANILY